jgi:hypothetical protein
MISALLNRKALKAIAHRRESLIKFMESCEEHMKRLGYNKDSEEYQRWYRMYWDAWGREEELSSLEDYVRNV